MKEKKSVGKTTRQEKSMHMKQRKSLGGRHAGLRTEVASIGYFERIFRSPIFSISEVEAFREDLCFLLRREWFDQHVL